MPVQSGQVGTACVSRWQSAACETTPPAYAGGTDCGNVQFGENGTRGVETGRRIDLDDINISRRILAARQVLGKILKAIGL